MFLSFPVPPKTHNEWWHILIRNIQLGMYVAVDLGWVQEAFSNPVQKFTYFSDR